MVSLEFFSILSVIAKGKKALAQDMILYEALLNIVVHLYAS